MMVSAFFVNDPATLEAMCHRAGIAPSSISPLAGGFSNANYRVESSVGTVVLRLYREPAAAVRERKLHELVGASIPVPRVQYVEPDRASLGKAFAVVEHVEGILLDRFLVGNEVAAGPIGEAVGAVLARIGGFSFQESGFLDSELHPTGAPKADDSIVGYVRERLESKHGRTTLSEVHRLALLRALEDAVGNLPDLGLQRRLVHCDFNPKNVIVRRTGSQWEVAAVLDWEFAFSGTPLWDVANMMRHRDAYSPAFCAGFIGSFTESGGELPEDWDRAGRAIDTVNLAEFLAKEPSNPFFEFARRRLSDVAETGRF